MINRSCFFSQIDAFWFVRYLPSERKRIQEFKKMSAILNDFAQKKIAQTKENLDNGIESSDFISVYLKEVENSKNKLQDRYIPIFKIFTFLPINRDYFDK